MATGIIDNFNIQHRTANCSLKRKASNASGASIPKRWFFCALYRHDKKRRTFRFNEFHVGQGVARSGTARLLPAPLSEFKLFFLWFAFGKNKTVSVGCWRCAWAGMRNASEESDHKVCTTFDPSVDRRVMNIRIILCSRFLCLRLVLLLVSSLHLSRREPLTLTTDQLLWPTTNGFRK